MCAQHDGDARRPQPDPALERRMARINARIAAHVAEHGTAHTFAGYVEATADRIVLETDAPDDLVDSLLADEAGSGAVVVRRGTISDTAPGSS